jgi:hypothetical protein
MRMERAIKMRMDKKKVSLFSRMLKWLMSKTKLKLSILKSRVRARKITLECS